jgi:membrane protease YdiL (CAAX protease family)
VNIHFLRDDKKQRDLSTLLFVYASLFLLWTGYRLIFSLPEWVDEFIAKPLVWISPLAIFQKTYIKQFIVSFKKRIVQSAAFGLAMGALYFAIFTMLTRFASPPTINPDKFDALQLILQALIALSTGLIEEVVFRGYILEKSLTIFHDRLIANSFSTLLFTLIHLPIILLVYRYAVPQMISYLAILYISGFVYGLVYLKNKSLTASTMTHAVWNFLGTIIR